MIVRITIKTLRSGQPRAYADSVHEEEIFLEYIPYNKTEFEPWVITSNLGKPLSAENVSFALAQYVPALRVHPRSKNTHGLQPYLSHFGPIFDKPGYYRAVVVSPFTD